MEEYWHCDQFYFVEHSRFQITRDEVKEYIQLPSTLAFENQMLFMAERDWLGYALLSYFQESSIRFYGDCCEFYKTVEEKYQIEGFFEPWMKHIQLDFDQHHAENFAELLSSNQIFELKAVTDSFENAWFAFQFLLRSLDEILDEDQKSTKGYIRTPPCSSKRLIKRSTLVLDYEVTNNFKFLSKNLFDLLSEIQDRKMYFSQRKDRGLFYAIKEISGLAAGVIDAAYKALGNARGHDQVIAIGEIVESLEMLPQTHINEPKPRLSAETKAVINFLREVASDPLEFCFYCLQLSGLQDSIFLTDVYTSEKITLWFPLNLKRLNRTVDLLQNSETYPKQVDRLVNGTLQLNEQLDKLFSYERNYFSEDLFCDAQS